MSASLKEVKDIDMRCRNYKCPNWGTAYPDFCSVYETDSFLYCDNFKRKDYTIDKNIQHAREETTKTLGRES